MTPAGTSNEFDVQNKWEENTHTHTSHSPFEEKLAIVQKILRKSDTSQYLVAVDLTSYVGTIPTWLASYFLV